MVKQDVLMCKLTGPGDFVKAVRVKSGMSQREFGEKLEVSRSYVSKVENGKSNPSGKYLERIAEHFRVEMIFISSEYMSKEELENEDF